MANNDQLTTRWIRLQREAARAAKEADDAVVPFAQASQPPPELQVPFDEDDFGIERLVLDSWRAFFARFRADEAEFELPHYLTAGQVVEERLARLGTDARPDLITCRMILDLLRQFEEARFRDFNDRVSELVESSQQLKANLDVAELSKCYQEDELQSCQRMVQKELTRRGIVVKGPAELVDPSPSAQVRALLASIGAQETTLVTRTPAVAVPLPVVEAAAEVIDVHARDSLDWTKLHSAASLGKAELITLLLDKGADINAKAKDGSAPLHLAVKRSHPVAVKLLFARGANPSAKDQEGNSPLHVASELYVPDMLKVLTDLGAMVNARNNENWTPLHLAANRGKREVVEYLLSAGADINAVAANGWTPLKVAANCGHLQLSELLRSRGARQ
ncbi:MAG: ankyrin repeat domain-containing protein [Planctomycetes bacterium]|nr:ankyrin repeat domain-containing protein [Planctomycetota bacterium]